MDCKVYDGNFISMPYWNGELVNWCHEQDNNFFTFTAENQSSCYDHCRMDQVGCPLFFNEKIIEQPTDLTKLTEKYTQAALKFVKNSVRKQQKPFFLYMAYHQTHHPQFASELKISQRLGVASISKFGNF